MKYLYYAIFHRNEQGQYEVSFPDFEPYVATYVEDMADALQQARDALAGYLLTQEDYHEQIPHPSDPENIKYDKNDLLIPIETDTTVERAKEENELVKKTLTIPQYVNNMAQAQNINFSATLTRALKQELNLTV